ncbi:MAG: winged helix-turn-helix domain-containing protein [Candidatus Bipolaricaulia bacterium]
MAGLKSDWKINPKHIPVLMAVSIALLFIAFAILIFYRYSADVKDQIIRRGETIVHAFAEEVGLYLVARDEVGLDHAAKRVVMGDVLYAQVVRSGEILVDEKAFAGLKISTPIEDLFDEIKVEEKRWPNGNPYLDIIRSLGGYRGGVASGDYVRIGVSLVNTRYQLRSEMLTTLLIGLGFVTVGTLLIFALTRIAWSPRDGSGDPLAEIDRVEAGDLNAQVNSPETTENLQTTNSGTGNPIMKINDLMIDDHRKEVRIRGEAVELSPKEYQLLKLLASEPGRVYSNEEILEVLWPEGGFATSGDVKQYIYMLRSKVEQNSNKPRIILTVRGFGYKLSA